MRREGHRTLSYSRGTDEQWRRAHCSQFCKVRKAEATFGPYHSNQTSGLEARVHPSTLTHQPTDSRILSTIPSNVWKEWPCVQMATRILIVDDERVVTEVVERYLKLEGYDAAVAMDGADALKVVQEWKPHLVVLDLMLPILDGLEVCRILRKNTDLPIIMLTARGEETDRIVGLEMGADDYMVKPFSPRELVARVKSVLRRAGTNQNSSSGSTVRHGSLEINPDTREVSNGARKIELTAKEFDLLFFLASRPNRVFTRTQLMDQVWDYSYAADYSTVTVHIRRLRAKLETDPMKPRYVKTVWGVGYKFEA